MSKLYSNLYAQNVTYGTMISISISISKSTQLVLTTSLQETSTAFLIRAFGKNIYRCAAVLDPVENHGRRH